MIRSFRKGAWATTLLGLGFTATSLAQSPYGANQPADHPAKNEAGLKVEAGPLIAIPALEPESAAAQPLVSPNHGASVFVKQEGKPGRRGMIMSELKQLDGTITFKIKTLDNGDVLFVNEKNAEITREDAIETLPPPKVVETASMPGPIIIPPADFASHPTVLPLDKVQEGQPTAVVPPAPAAPIGQVVVEPVPHGLLVPPVEERSNPPSLWRKLFGKPESAKSCPPVCAPCLPRDSMPPAIAGHATVAPPLASAPGHAIVDTTPGHASIDLGPAAANPQPITVRTAREPLSIAATGFGAGQHPEDFETAQLRKIKEMLKTDMLPSHRVAAAEDILQCVPGRLNEIREILIQCAKDDPAACVRASCIHALSKLNTREDSFASLLDSSLDDESADVRDEATYALDKLKRK